LVATATTKRSCTWQRSVNQEGAKRSGRLWEDPWLMQGRFLALMLFCKVAVKVSRECVCTVKASLSS
jgi:hypothetical protein